MDLSQLMLGKMVENEHQEIYGVKLFDSNIIIKRSLFYVLDIFQETYTIEFTFDQSLYIDENIQIPSNIEEHFRLTIYNPLKIGDILLIAKINQGQQFIILGRVKPL